MIDKKEIHKIAALAKIDIKYSELDTYSDQISKILIQINLEYLSSIDFFFDGILVKVKY